jgi:predicted nucleic acid-binding protein
MVVFDSNFLLFLLHENLPAPEHPDTKETVLNCKERIDYLVARLNKSKEKIIIPTPVVAELLIRAESAALAWLNKINKEYAFSIADFDTRAAVEVSCMAAAALKTGNKKDGSTNDATWAKVKYDRQIVATALVLKAGTIYTNDKSLAATATKHKIKVVGIHELELPPEEAQKEFDWEATENGVIKPIEEATST